MIVAAAAVRTGEREILAILIAFIRCQCLVTRRIVHQFTRTLISYQKSLFVFGRIKVDSGGKVDNRFDRRSIGKVQTELRGKWPVLIRFSGFRDEMRFLSGPADARRDLHAPRAVLLCTMADFRA